MEELQLTLTQARVDQRNFGVMLSNWRVGQTLNALVVDTRNDSSVLLSVGGKQFVATTDLPVQKGTQMLLEVKQTGQEVILKQVQGAQVQRTDAGGRAAEAALALSSARSAPLLNQLAAQPARFGSPEFQDIARTLLGRSLNGESMKPSDVRRAVRDSGVFTETDLVAGNTRSAGNSAKTQLSRLQAMALALADNALDDSAEMRVLSQIADRAGALLNGIANNQLASLPGDDGQRWVFNLPVQLQEQFHDVRMQIEQDRESIDGEEETVWRANLNVDLPQLGAVDIRVQMAKGQVSVNFVCEQDRSSTILKNGMGGLEQRLVQRDIPVDSLSASALDKPDHEPPPSSGLSVEA